MLLKWRSIATLSLITWIMLLRLNSLASAEDFGLPIHGYIDIIGGFTYGTRSVDDGGNPISGGAPYEETVRGFRSGNLDFYLTPHYDRVVGLLELNIEPELATETMGIDLERAQIGYLFSDELTIWAGRFHVPYGFWNTGFHHGQQLQLSIRRPRFVEFEDLGGILPTHTIGLWGTGSLKTGNTRISYDAFISNGPKLVDNVLDPNLAKDDNTSPMFGGRIGISPNGAISGLTLGLHGFTTQIDGLYSGDNGGAPFRRDPPSTFGHTFKPTGASTRVNMYGGFVIFDEHGVDFLAELYHYSNSDLTVPNSKSQSSTFGFAQVGYGISERFTPFVRFERASLNPSDVYMKELSQGSMQQGRSYTKEAIGIKCDINDKTAVKFEAAHTVIGGDGSINSVGDLATVTFNEWRMQYALGF
ncbi:MAG: hypothetical protein AABZ55_06285 [Bdellovibrionota bacterium]